jgi:hypothetical protein
MNIDGPRRTNNSHATLSVPYRMLAPGELLASTADLIDVPE